NQGIETKPVPWWPNSSSIAVGQVSRVSENRRALLRLGHVDTGAMKAVNPLLIQSRDPITPVFAGDLRRALSRARDPRLHAAWKLFKRWAASGYRRVDSNGDGRFDSPAVEIFGADDTSYSDLPDSAYPRTLWHEPLRRVFTGDLAGAPLPGTWPGQLSVLKIVLDGRIGHRRPAGHLLRTEAARSPLLVSLRR